MATRRADIVLTELGLARSRTQAKELIEKGYVHCRTPGGVRAVQKGSEEVDVDCEELFVQDNDLSKFVSRAALKLKGAFEELDLTVKGLNVLDVGLSTGGFSQLCLQMGAAGVWGIDSGTQQVHTSLYSYKNFTAFENTNIRELETKPEIKFTFPPQGFDLVVVDVSFISLQLVIPHIVPFVAEKGVLLCLVKPQFEVGAANIGKNGIVKNRKIVVSLMEELRHKIKAALLADDIKSFPSSLEGRDGNQEYFIYAKKS